MDKEVFVIVVAGGHGTRMGAATPKQFLPLEGKPILRRTIEVFTAAWPGIRVITVLPREHIDFWKDYCLRSNFTVPQTLVPGGITRFHSVRNALEKVPDGAVVAIQDGVRPLLTPALVRSMIGQMGPVRGLIPVVPVADTLKALRPEGEDGRLVTIPGEEPDRSRLWAAQTPQVFLSEDIKSAYSQAYDTAFTDDASVAAKKQIPLAWTAGERLNFKITTPEDLMLAKAVILSR